MSELRECPFCGGEAVLTPRKDLQAAYVWCGDCKKCGTGYFPSTEQAIFAWNTRNELTCKDIGNSTVAFKCSECGSAVTGGYIDNAYIVSGDWNYCPNCGARVVEVDE